MKRILCLLTAACVTFMLVACSGESDGVQRDDEATIAKTEDSSILAIPGFPDSPKEDPADPFVLGPTTFPQSSVIWGAVQLHIDSTISRYYFTKSEIESITDISVGGSQHDGTNSGLTGMEILVNLESITFTGGIVHAHFRRLERLPHLRTLRFERYALPIRDLTFISYLRNLTRQLRRLEIIGDEDAKALMRLDGIQNFRNLERLEIPNNRNYTGGDTHSWRELNYSLSLEGVERLRNLQVLNISGNKLTSLDALRQLRNLTNLNASNNQLTDISALRNLTNLERVDLSGNRLSEQELRNNLPEHLINREGGEEWLQRQIESQNSG